MIPAYGPNPFRSPNHTHTCSECGGEYTGPCDCADVSCDFVCEECADGDYDHAA
jgi:hypothetical protein